MKKLNNYINEKYLINGGGVCIFYASINPNEYDIEKISKMSYDEAVKFFKHDTINACNTKEITIQEGNEGVFYADGVDGGDYSDTLFVWYKTK